MKQVLKILGHDVAQAGTGVGAGKQGWVRAGGGMGRVGSGFGAEGSGLFTLHG